MVALTLPHTMALRLSFEHGAILDGLPGWREFFATPVEARMAVLSDPAARGSWTTGPSPTRPGVLRLPGRLGPPGRRRDLRPGEPGHSRAGRSGEVAAERGLSAWDALCEIVVADRLRTGFSVPIPVTDADWAARAAGLAGPAGRRRRFGRRCAPRHHVRSGLLDDPARRRCAPSAGLLPIEEAVRLLTEVPARPLRPGRPRPGGRGRAGRTSWSSTPSGWDPGRCARRDDLPGGASRLYAGATGMEHVLVNGTEVVTADKLTGAVPGTVLRSGKDTVTVPVPGAAA